MNNPDWLYELKYQKAKQKKAADKWRSQARPDQLRPLGDWYVWLILAGRGWGKTRTGAEDVLQAVRDGYKWIALVAPTAADARDVMVEGQSGILACASEIERPIYEPSKRRLTFPNGAIAHTYSADEPERLRGPQHDYAWCDEVGAWRYATEAWDMLMFGLRLGQNPRCVVTTTPRPIKLIKELFRDKTTHITSGRTYDNLANLAPAFAQKIIAKYEGTRLGRQELEAELMEDVPGALWNLGLIEQYRVKEHPELQRIVVAIDPATTNNEESDETGIVVAGVGKNGHGYLLADITVKDTPAKWARVAIDAYHTWKADRIVAEANNGGDMVENTIRTVRDENDNPIGRNVSFKKVNASRGKLTRAEPVSSLYEQGRVHHVGAFKECEDQMCTWLPGEKSPDRMDALVWGFSELMLKDDSSLTIQPAPAFLQEWRGG